LLSTKKKKKLRRKQLSGIKQFMDGKVDVWLEAVSEVLGKKQPPLTWEKGRRCDLLKKEKEECSRFGENFRIWEGRTLGCQKLEEEKGPFS